MKKKKSVKKKPGGGAGLFRLLGTDTTKMGRWKGLSRKKVRGWRGGWMVWSSSKGDVIQQRGTEISRDLIE